MGNIANDNKKMPLRLPLFSIQRSTLITLFNVTVFRVMLDVSYCFVIGQVWRNNGFALDIVPLKLWESYIAFFLLLSCMPKKSDKVSHAILQLFFLVAYIPIQTYYAFSNQDRAWFYCFTLFLSIVIILNRCKLRFSFKPLKESKHVLLVIMFVFSILSVILIYLYMDFSFNMNLSEVYEIRRNYAAANIPLSGYMISWTAKVLMPFMILMALFNKKGKTSYLLLFIAVAIQLFIFSSSGHKSHLFRIPAIIVLALLVNKEKFFARLSIAFTSLVSAGIFLYLQFNDFWVVSLFSRRTFLLPAKISFFYHEYFSENDLIYLSHSIFKSFIDYPYQMFPAHLIGKAYFRESQPGLYAWANTGIVGDGYMNFGYIGVFLWAILLATLLKFVDAVTESTDIKIVWPILLITFYSMVDGAPLTTLLTHGLLFALLLCYLTPKEKFGIEND
jgi:oligosaccharide repeat unit polymerase